MIMMDADGSHPLDVLPEMMRQYLGGAQVVAMRPEDTR